MSFISGLESWHFLNQCLAYQLDLIEHEYMKKKKLRIMSELGLSHTQSIICMSMVYTEWLVDSSYSTSYFESFE